MLTTRWASLIPEAVGEAAINCPASERPFSTRDLDARAAHAFWGTNTQRFAK
jgi:hypothetical protein